MRDFIIKHFGRILAILGCSTVVTACYGSPYRNFDIPPDLSRSFCVKGRVIDAETDLPIEYIEVKVVPSLSVPMGENVEKYSPVHTFPDGSFSVTFHGVEEPSSYTIECTDVDGFINRAYESVSEEVPSEESCNVVIRMTPRHV